MLLNPSLKVETIPGGRGGTAYTLSRMAELTRESFWYARRKALEIVRGAADNRDFARAVDSFIRLQMMIVDEPDELLHAPEFLLRQIESQGRTFGDCDDAAMVVASLMTGIGIPVRFKAVNPSGDGSFSHVFAEWYDAGAGWVALDPTIPHYPVYPPEVLIQEI